jgi:hypothetical protein
MTSRYETVVVSKVDLEGDTVSWHDGFSVSLSYLQEIIPHEAKDWILVPGTKWQIGITNGAMLMSCIPLMTPEMFRNISLCHQVGTILNTYVEATPIPESVYSVGMDVLVTELSQTLENLYQEYMYNLLTWEGWMIYTIRAANDILNEVAEDRMVPENIRVELSNV